MARILVAYYSFSGVTREWANEITRQTRGDLRELITIKPYAFDYNTAAKEARSQIARGYCPELAAGNGPIAQYAAVFVGTPNWFKSMAPPVLSFLKGHDLSGKTVIPFCTHGGGGFGEIESQMAEACPNAVLLPGLALSGEVRPDQIQAWLKGIPLF